MSLVPKSAKKEEEAAAQDRDEVQVTVGVVSGDAATEGADPCAEFRRGNQDLSDIVLQGGADLREKNRKKEKAPIFVGAFSC